MKVIIAEKPDQGMTLASPFQSKKHQGYIEIYPNELFPKGAYVTWAVGHLFQLAPPESYRLDWKKWVIDTLPIIPERFDYEIDKTKAKQYKTIVDLLRKREVTEIIHAGDAGREGELIIRNIIRMSGTKKPMKRLWISSLTPKAIYEGFRNLLEEQETRNLYYEAFSRACADWLVGMNASRVYSILMKEKGMNDLFSAGRVQTPTLALIVKREKEIESFQPEPFWEVVATFHIEGKIYEGKWVKDKETRLKDEQLAKKIAEFCHNKNAEIKEIIKERKEFQPPLLFNLSSLQATANKIYQFSPKKTLDVLQGLYQKGIVSYPRSDSNYVTRGEAETFPEILQKISEIQEYEQLFPLPNTSIIHNKRYVNEKKVTDHYAIIPTEQVIDPKVLTADERKIYDLIIRRLIAAHYEQAIYDYTTIVTLVDNRAEFISKGKQQIQEGWRKVIYQHEQDEEVKTLPEVKEGEKGRVTSTKVREGKTQPPKRYSEGELITLMKTAGKFLDNEELEKVLMKTEGLGTEATRAGIITMLKERKYITVKKNEVYAADKGRLLIEAIGDNILASPEMTAKWEQRLTEIGEGKASPTQFMEQVKKLSAKIVQDALEKSNHWDFSGMNIDSIKQTKTKRTIGKTIGKCKLCSGTVIDKGDFYGCTNYKTDHCAFTISKTILGKKITQTNVKKFLENGKTSLIKGFRKGDKTFDAYLVWDETKRRVSFAFEKE